MRFSHSMIRMTSQQKMAMLGGRLALSLARQNGDPLAKQYDDLKKRLDAVKSSLQKKYGRSASRLMRK